MRVLLLLLIFFKLSSVSFARTSTATMTPDSKWLRQELLRIGLSRSFTEESLQNYEPKGFNTVVTLNLMGFMQESGAHLTKVSPRAIKQSTAFIKDNQTAFQQAESAYNVPPEVISSLIWMETRHGEDLGTFHTVSVYLHLLQAKKNSNIQELTKIALKKNKKNKKYTTKEIRKIMVERTKKKSLWAQDQLIALASLRKNKHLEIQKLRGSYAGAFGLAQFIPSSYRDYAVAQRAKSVPDLSKSADAIMSVANYLASFGWKNKDPEAQIAALMKYNNSRDYADGILNVSRGLPANLVANNPDELSP